MIYIYMCMYNLDRCLSVAIAHCWAPIQWHSIKLCICILDRAPEAEDKTRKERDLCLDKTSGLCRTRSNMLACVGLYPVLCPRASQYARNTQSSRWCKMSKTTWHTGAGLGLDPEMIDWCCLKLQSYHQFEGWQSFKNMCIVECVKYCNFETLVQLHPWFLMLNAYRLGTGPTR